MRISNLYIFMLLFLAAGCSGDTPDFPGEDDDYPTSQLYLRLELTVATGGSTRSNPTGGENGDGRELGLEREDRVRDLNIYLYNYDDGSGINCDVPSAIDVKKHLYIPSVTAMSVKVPLSGYTPVENDRIIIIANAGESVEADNLGDLRDKVCNNPWSGSIVKETTGFTMGTARLDDKNGKIDVSRSGTFEDPYKSEVTIERTAARIDFWFKNENIPASGDVSELVYDVKGTDGNPTGSKVWIQHITPVNSMQNPSYIFKHVTEGFSTDKILVCANETPNPTGKPTNYVITPTTLSLLTTASESLLYGLTRAEYIRANAEEIFNEGNSVASIFKNGEQIDYSESGKDFNRYVILAYTNENTQIGKAFTSKYTTGLVFKAIYQPGKVYSGYKPATEEEEEVLTEDNSDYSAGKDFWSLTIVGQTMEERQNLYFSNEEVAESYKGAHPELNCMITKFEGGVCYYNLWLKHANEDSDPHEGFPMEYAIVRNNIYRVGVTFSGPGDPTPELREPNHIKSYIFVRKWNFRLQPEINV